MTVNFLIAVLSTYLAAGAWFPHGVVTDKNTATTLDRSFIADGLARLNPGGVTAIILFSAIWPIALIASFCTRYRK